MSRAPVLAVPEDTRARQHRASHPQSSAWVSANAGSGKTHVLTQRVVRLLLGDVPPARILCLTFTKAAAANMSIRVFDTLAEWTRLDDAALTEAILRTGAPRPSTTDLALARKLFARTVETPGGLKIQTIHAFCERLLHLFPFEANVAARFSVLDDLHRAELLQAARTDALAQAAMAPGSALGRAVAFLAREASSFTFEALVGEALSHRETLQAAVLLGEAIASFGPGLRRALGLGPDDTLASVEHGMLHGGLDRAGWAAAAQRLGADGGPKDSAGNRLARAALATGEAALEAYLDVFLTKTRTPRDGKYLVQALRKVEPDLCDALDRERDRLVAALDTRRAAETFERTLALVTVAKTVLDGYEATKRRRGLLDFDDLVERTRTLLSRSSAAWVLHKLDAGIDHVLVDEAQDTSPAQWQILAALTDDFFSGAGSSQRIRTIFAVGDEKQSIYSFQGAEPAQFAIQRAAFGKAAAHGDARFEAVTLNLSFRSTRAVLELVDGVFAAGDHAVGLSEPGLRPPPHEALRSRTPGLVELWPLVGPTPQADPVDWRLPLDQPDPQSPPVTLARRVADRIHAMLAPGSDESVEDRGTGGRRRIVPGDILILVRSRNAVFDAVIRALKDRHVPVAGADRLELTEHIAVMDLMAAGRAALLPDDDLTVASVMKSPLIGLDDDDLIALAPGRRGSLLAALEASTEARHRRAAAILQAWRLRAATETPFGFYARLLGPDGGRRAMLARLGQEAGDAVDEFVALTLAHERDGPPSLTRFLADLEGQSLSVKRDMEASGEAVRVMTVHAAKGLEAKIVFLPDTCGAPSGRHDPALFPLAGEAAAVLAWSPKRDRDPGPVAAVRQALRQAALEEHRRLLYVALTRAEERLYIAGFHGPAGPAEGCWYAMIAASELGLDEAPSPWSTEETVLRRADPGLTAVLPPPAPISPTATLLPEWVTAKPSREVSYAPPVRPSSALDAADQAGREPEAPLNARSEARRRQAAVGRLAHRLLQALPDLPASARGVAAARYLASHGAALDAERQASLVREVLGVLDDPTLHPLFGAGSRAEVGIAGRAVLADGRPIDIAGQIDRIGVTGDAVFIADFKTGRPHAADDLPQSYVAQLALYRAAVGPLYPGKRVRAFLVWTAGPTVVELPPARLDAALHELTGPPED